MVRTQAETLRRGPTARARARGVFPIPRDGRALKMTCQADRLQRDYTDFWGQLPPQATRKVETRYPPAVAGMPWRAKNIHKRSKARRKVGQTSGTISLRCCRRCQARRRKGRKKKPPGQRAVRSRNRKGLGPLGIAETKQRAGRGS